MTTTSPKIAARAAVLYTLHMQKQLSYTVTVKQTGENVKVNKERHRNKENKVNKERQEK